MYASWIIVRTLFEYLTFWADAAFSPWTWFQVRTQAAHQVAKSSSQQKRACRALDDVVMVTVHVQKLSIVLLSLEWIDLCCNTTRILTLISRTGKWRIITHTHTIKCMASFREWINFWPPTKLVRLLSCWPLADAICDFVQTKCRCVHLPVNNLPKTVCRAR